MRLPNPVATVELLLNTTLEKRSGRWTTRCPWHDDHDPSLALYQTKGGTWRVGCWACSSDYSLMELVQHCLGCSPGEASRWLLDEAPDERDGRWESVSREERMKRFDAGRWHSRLEAAQITAKHEGRALLDLFRALKRIEPSADHLISRWGIGVEGGAILVPHFLKPYDTRLAAVKTRRRGDGWTPRSVPGSDLTELYGWQHLQRGRSGIVICEGESDTWSVDYWLATEPHRPDVAGLPHGASAFVRDEWLSMVAGHANVTLLFDADDAGRDAESAWKVALPRARVARLPDGYDATKAGKETTLEAISCACS